MRTVFSIFKGDVMSLVKRFFAMAVAIAISVLPALYAWVNIYANGNPYVNTKGIKIAVASYDPGIDLEDGTHVNSAEKIINENLKKSESIGWQFPEKPEDAVAGVESGEYYAAIIFEKDFTYNMYHFDYALTNKDAPVTFYRNDKKNAVASKITDTAASKLLESINTEYLRTVFARVFGDANALADDLNDVDAVNAAIARLTDLRDNLDAYNNVVGSFVSNSSKLVSSIDSTSKKLQNTSSKARSDLSRAQANLNSAVDRVEQLKQNLDVVVDDINGKTADLKEKLKELTDANPDGKQRLQEEATARADSLLARLQSMKEVIDASQGTPGSQAASATLDSMIAQTEAIKTAIANASDNKGALDNAIKTLEDLGNNNLKKDVDTMIDAMKVIVKNMSPIAENLIGTAESIEPVLGASKDTVESLDMSMRQLQVVLQSSSEGLTNLIDRLANANLDEKMKILIDFLGGDPERYAQFFSSLVDVQVEEVYPVASYGAAMAPFYSALAIWVGGVILVAILKTQINKEKFPNATDRQAFFGRFLLFFVMNQIQAAVIAIGDIYLLNISPKHPIAFWFAASVAGFVFTLLIYALTRTFGDIGKAAVVVTMVVQIAGSSGSYPIEILPEIFSKIYRFFPFPYAINAMREAICGMYKYDYWIYLGELLLFAVLALAIGLLARKSMIGIDEFVSEKIEETEVL